MEKEANLLELSFNEKGLFNWNAYVELLRERHKEISIVWFSAIHYYTGEWLPMANIVQEAHKYKILVGFDLAHAIGNVHLKLHDWNVDFAVWCSYKYLNAGPGAIGGLYVNSRHFPLLKEAGMKGWWGNKESSRFEMSQEFRPSENASCVALSTPNVISIAALIASLEIFEAVGIERIQQNALYMTGQFFEQFQALGIPKSICCILTPGERGAQISILVDKSILKELYEAFFEDKIIVDVRYPRVIRLAFCGLYNNMKQVAKCIELLKKKLVLFPLLQLQ
jgi:kynureninase